MKAEIRITLDNLEDLDGLNGIVQAVKAAQEKEKTESVKQEATEAAKEEEALPAAPVAEKPDRKEMLELCQQYIDQKGPGTLVALFQQIDSKVRKFTQLKEEDWLALKAAILEGLNA